MQNLSVKNAAEWLQRKNGCINPYLLNENISPFLLDLWHMIDKPVINIGTGPVNRDLIGEVIDDLLFGLNELSIPGHPISVGENIVFKGGCLCLRPALQCRVPCHEQGRQADLSG